MQQNKTLSSRYLMKMVAIICVVIYSTLIGAVLGKSLSQEKLLTFKTKSGQLYDCIDFYKQSTFKERPWLNQVERNPKGNGRLEYGGCPLGSVPILRVDATNQVLPHFMPSQPGNDDEAVKKDYCTAVVQTTIGDSKRKFYGSNAAISLHKPYVPPGQSSVARIKFINGRESIEAGWMVNPTFFKDNEAHLYARMQVGERACLNMECPGFVLVSKDVSLGVKPKQYSAIGEGTKYTWNVTIEKHSDDGHWWVILVANSNTRYAIGYWPKSVFTSLSEVANQVEWGGQVFFNGTEKVLPYMGNGRKAAYNTDKSAFFRHVTVDTTGNGQYVQPDGTVLFQEEFDTCYKFYTVLDKGNQGDYWGRLMFYGGYDK